MYLYFLNGISASPCSTYTPPQARAAKRATLSWQDFSSAGFTRSDAPLSDTLQFSPPVANSINAWPAQSAEMHRKLKKAQKALPAFGWDTEPVMGTEEVIEEAFLDVFCDLIYGGGWLDVERTEELDRECNWALVRISLSISVFPNRSLPHFAFRLSINPYRSRKRLLLELLIPGPPPLLCYSRNSFL